MSSQDKSLLIALSCVFGPILMSVAIIVSYLNGRQTERDIWRKETISRGYVEKYIDGDCINYRWIKEVKE